MSVSKQLSFCFPSSSGYGGRHADEGKGGDDDTPDGTVVRADAPNSGVPGTTLLDDAGRPLLRHLESVEECLPHPVTSAGPCIGAIRLNFLRKETSAPGRGLRQIGDMEAIEDERETILRCLNDPDELDQPVAGARTRDPFPGLARRAAHDKLSDVRVVHLDRGADLSNMKRLAAVCAAVGLLCGCSGMTPISNAPPSVVTANYDGTTPRFGLDGRRTAAPGNAYASKGEPSAAEEASAPGLIVGPSGGPRTVAQSSSSDSESAAREAEKRQWELTYAKLRKSTDICRGC